MRLLDEIMHANETYLQLNDVNPPDTQVPRPPQRKVAIFTCMDGRLVELLEPALGISRGDAHIIKNAGNTIAHRNSEVIRSLIVSIFFLEVEEVLVVGHRDCGMTRLNTSDLESSMLERGVPQEAIDGVDNWREWLGGFAHPEWNVRNVVQRIRESPLIPNDVPVHGLIMEPQRGALKLLVDGYGHVENGHDAVDAAKTSRTETGTISGAGHERNKAAK